VTVRATGTIGTVFGILRGTLPDTKRQKGMLGLESDLRHHLFRHESIRLTNFRAFDLLQCARDVHEFFARMRIKFSQPSAAAQADAY